MNRRKYFMLSISIMFFFILISTPTLNAQIYERGFRIGTSLEYSFESREKESMVLTNDTLNLIYEFKEHSLIKLNITDIDELNEVLVVQETDTYSHTDSSILDFSTDYVSTNIANSLFYFNYYWDSNLNRVYLSSFDLYVPYFHPFVQPDWEIFNLNLNETLNGDQIIDAVDTGSIIEYIRLDDFLSEVSFIINGQNTIESARNSFTAEKSRWKFEFDLSGYIIDRDYNYQEDIYEYFEYDRYDAAFELEYSKGGILSEMSSSLIYSVTKQNEKYTYEDVYSIVVGDSKTTSIDYNIIFAIIVLAIFPILFQIRKKRKDRWLNE